MNNTIKGLLINALLLWGATGFIIALVQLHIHVIQLYTGLIINMVIIDIWISCLLILVYKVLKLIQTQTGGGK